MNATIREEDFEAAAMPHLNDLFRTALRVTGNRNEAEDVTQETYLQAWKSFHRFEMGTNCRAWMFKILFHVIKHHRRKWFKFNLRSVQSSEELVEDTLAYEPPIPQSLTDEDVIAAFERIPVQYKEVILLADVEEFSYKEIAETLDIPLGTVMSRLNRGRKLMRSELSGYAKGYRIENAGGAVQSAAAGFQKG